MKKLILLLFLGLLIFGCTSPNLENSVPNPETFTKVEHLKMDKDTITVIYKDADDKLILYVYDEESSTIIRQYQLTNNHSSSPLPIGGLISIILLFLFGGMLLYHLIDL